MRRATIVDDDILGRDAGSPSVTLLQPRSMRSAWWQLLAEVSVPIVPTVLSGLFRRSVSKSPAASTWTPLYCNAGTGGHMTFGSKALQEEKLGRAAELQTLRRRSTGLGLGAHLLRSIHGKIMPTPQNWRALRPGTGLPADLVSEWAARPLSEVVSLVHKVGGPLNWALFAPAAQQAARE